MNRRASATVAGACFTAYAVLGAVYSGRPPRHERRAFRQVNRRAGDQPWLRVPQQLGTPWTLPTVGVIAALRRQHPLAIAALVALVALPAEKGLEVATKKVVDRPRPAQVLTPQLRDDAPTDGPSYPSGHAAIAACSVWLLAPLLPAPATAVLAACAGLTALTRVHQGAHHPTDAIGGLALGTGLGALLTAGASTWRTREAARGWA